MPDPAGLSVTDQILTQHAIALAGIEPRLKVVEEETAKMRTFKHDINNTLMRLVGVTENLADDIKVLAGLSMQFSELKQAHATHVAVDDERYKRIEEHMEASKVDRAEIKVKQEATDKKIGDSSIRVLVGLLLFAISVIGALYYRFGWPPMTP